MPIYRRPSPISNFFNSFLQGLQVYDQFQRTNEMRKRTEQEQQQLDLKAQELGMTRQQLEESITTSQQKRQQEQERFAEGMRWIRPRDTAEFGPGTSFESADPNASPTGGLAPRSPVDVFKEGMVMPAGPRSNEDVARGLAVMGSPTAAAMAGLVKTEEPNLMPVPPGNVIFDKRIGAPVFVNPAEPKAPLEADKERDILAQDVLGADGRPLYKSFAELQEKNPKAAADVERKRKAASALVVRETPPAERRLNRIDAPFIVDKYGNNVPLNKILGKQLSEVPEAVAVLSATELPGLKAAQRVVRIGEELKALAPQILKKYGGVSLGQMFKVVGNKIYLTEIAQRAGDPNVVKFQTLLNGFLISEPQALGIPGGRESVRLLELVAKGAPTFGSTVEGLNAAIDTTINTDIAPAWEARGINVQGRTKKSSGNLPPGYEVVK